MPRGSDARAGRRARAGRPWQDAAAAAAWDRRGPALGEFELIERLRTIVPGGGAGVVRAIGDDTAVLRPAALLLATCDVQVEGIHFTRELCSPADVGWRALAVNLSDIAAMGGVPRHALVALLVPPSVGSAALEELYAGIAELARLYGVAVVGGNVSATSGPLAVDVTLLGDAEHPVLRSGARPGDGVWITGETGKAVAGRFLLEHAGMAVAARDTLEAAYRRPAPRVAAGRALGTLAASGLVTAMIDTSDGTASDLLHLAEASAVGVRLDAARLPMPAALPEIARAAGVAPDTWTLGGGEDYELLFTAAAGFEARAAGVTREAGVPLTRIGEVLAERDGRWVVTAEGERRPLRPAGWDHLAGAPARAPA
ncbi:MAG TPA: thiamine-phosphate kinase [bacterium]|nr:thiamine-phosphate kinase [bacterium]